MLSFVPQAMIVPIMVFAAFHNEDVQVHHQMDNRIARTIQIQQHVALCDVIEIHHGSDNVLYILSVLAHPIVVPHKKEI